MADSNLLFALVYPLTYSDAAARMFRLWLGEGREVVAPALWLYEAVSALRKMASATDLTVKERDEVLDMLLLLPVRTVQLDAGLHRQSLAWAERLDSPVAYDSAFVALAERLGADLWTADRRLARRLRDTGGVDVHWLLEPEVDARGGAG